MSNPVRTFNGEEYVPLEFYQEERKRWIELRKADSEKLYQRLATEAVVYKSDPVYGSDFLVTEKLAVPISVLKAIMEIKE